MIEILQSLVVILLIAIFNIKSYAQSSVTYDVFKDLIVPNYQIIEKNLQSIVVNQEKLFIPSDSLCSNNKLQSKIKESKNKISNGLNYKIKLSAVNNNTKTRYIEGRKYLEFYIQIYQEILNRRIKEKDKFGYFCCIFELHPIMSKFVFSLDSLIKDSYSTKSDSSKLKMLELDKNTYLTLGDQESITTCEKRISETYNTINLTKEQFERLRSDLSTVKDTLKPFENLFRVAQAQLRCSPESFYYKEIKSISLLPFNYN